MGCVGHRQCLVEDNVEGVSHVASGATDNNASPIVSYLNQQHHGIALALDIANHQTPLSKTLSKVLISPTKTEWLAAMKCV